MVECALAEGEAGIKKPTQLQALRGEITVEQLAPDSPPCLPRDLLTSEEVATLRRCSKSKVYRPRRRGTLEGTPDEPYQFFGWSVLRVMGWVDPPTHAVEPVPARKPLPVRRVTPPRRSEAVQGLRHLRIPLPEGQLPGDGAH